MIPNAIQNFVGSSKRRHIFESPFSFPKPPNFSNAHTPNPHAQACNGGGDSKPHSSEANAVPRTYKRLRVYESRWNLPANGKTCIRFATGRLLFGEISTQDTEILTSISCINLAAESISLLTPQAVYTLGPFHIQPIAEITLAKRTISHS